MVKAYMPFKDCSRVLGAETPQLRPPAFSDDPQYTTFSYTYCPGGLEISDSYIYYPGESEISEALAREIPTFTVPPTNYPGGLEISDSYIYYPGESEISEALAREIPTFTVPPTNYPGESEISEAVVPNINTLLYAIEATIDFSKAKGDLQGVLMAQGGCFGGHSFYIYQGKLCYVYNWLGQQQKITCNLPRLSSEMTLKVEFTKPKIITPCDENLGDRIIDNMKLYINNIEQNVDIIRAFSNHNSNSLIQYKQKIPSEFQGAMLRRVSVTIANDISLICDT
ncbi:MAG: hypothetical protein EWV92_16640 [Microcystis aeruginosa Ma_MB_S_20031200_S102]|uniref:Uncharacterized protein n=1 Tax=Microcystis aeruginosa Ma_MB_S_20031200_S102 TaxID=2486254 RepID=A0A552EH12_MICAE|nr:MAG: hypothetical protein EWV79_13000 [Microcystis aeruginosa Ma_MB_S_20031200_S102D]TRU33727.1 MAG: hypothetical protein EWV92_16640 [Microcystis aeruginosa Ma_MB_S_20031200_S102]